MRGARDSAAHAAPGHVKPLHAGTFGLPRAYRLKGPRFRAAFDAGTTRAGRYVVMWIRRTDAMPGQVGFVATKRMFARAVDRNRARRLMREAYRLTRPSLIEPVDIVLLARRPILNARLPEVAAALRDMCRQARLWRDVT